MLNQYVKTLLDANDILFDLALRGEIANFVQNARSGHCYFSLRDASASVKAVMFRSDARRLGFRPEEGMKVVVRCRATLYERDGAFQIYVNEMFPDGIGAAQLAFEQLKAKLEQEGLFAVEHKKPLPTYPKCIGVVTSKTGAALQDIRNVIDNHVFFTGNYCIRIDGLEQDDRSGRHHGTHGAAVVDHRQIAVTHREHNQIALGLEDCKNAKKI